MTGILHADLARDVVIVQGDDAGTFLHSQLAQDILSVPVGGSAHSLLLAPTGHVNALVRVVRHVDTVYTLDVERGLGEKVIARLQRYVLRSKVTMRPSDWSVRAYRGAGAGDAVGKVPGRATAWWGGDDAVDVVARAEDLPAAGDAVDPSVIETMRADARWPAMGSDIEEGDVPATTGVLSVAVSFTKGCYPGQELVERMDSRNSSAPVVLRAVPATAAPAGCTVTSRGSVWSIVRAPRGIEEGSPLGPPGL
ncbi:MAG: YgfZ/GcvT domain-containing protein [Actinomycetota bacterium]